MSHRRFDLVRHTDVSGISGTGRVAEGVQFTDGTVGMHWLTDLWSVTFFPDMETLQALHGHSGATEVVWLDAAVKVDGEGAS